MKIFDVEKKYFVLEKINEIGRTPQKLFEIQQSKHKFPSQYLKKMGLSAIDVVAQCIVYTFPQIKQDIWTVEALLNKRYSFWAKFDFSLLYYLID